MSESYFNKKKVRVSVCLDEPDYIYLRNFAKVKGLSFSDISRFIFRKFIEEEKRKQQS